MSISKTGRVDLQYVVQRKTFCSMFFMRNIRVRYVKDLERSTLPVYVIYIMFMLDIFRNLFLRNTKVFLQSSDHFLQSFITKGTLLKERHFAHDLGQYQLYVVLSVSYQAKGSINLKLLISLIQGNCNIVQQTAKKVQIRKKKFPLTLFNEK